jgi:hypothetical protein
VSGREENVFPVLQVAKIPPEETVCRWMIEGLWGASCVGLVGGAPKCCKSWTALEMAVSLASGTPCFGRYAVPERGTALLYLAEDSLPVIRERVTALAAHRGLAIDSLDVHVIKVPSMRLDLPGDQTRLHETVKELRPKLLVLDPLVRIHRIDENDASQVSALLSYLRGLQRELDLSVVLVHHTRKNHSPGMQAGQGLRGSGDFHAWSDSALYLRRNRGSLVLTIEHRAAASPDPIGLRLVASENGPHLEVVEGALEGDGEEGRRPLDTAILDALNAGPRTRGALRAELGVKNERLGEVLSRLEANGRIQRARDGWRRQNGEDQGEIVPRSPS